MRTTVNFCANTLTHEVPDLHSHLHAAPVLFPLTESLRLSESFRPPSRFYDQANLFGYYAVIFENKLVEAVGDNTPAPSDCRKSELEYYSMSIRLMEAVSTKLTSYSLGSV
jgi:hypothetical protein